MKQPQDGLLLLYAGTFFPKFKQGIFCSCAPLSVIVAQTTEVTVRITACGAIVREPLVGRSLGQRTPAGRWLIVHRNVIFIRSL